MTFSAVLTEINEHDDLHGANGSQEMLHVSPLDQEKIVSIALGLIVLMVVTSILSIFLAAKVGHLLDELTNRYIPAYGNLARANIRSLERGLALRRMVIAKMQNPPDEAAYASASKRSRHWRRGRPGS